MKHPNRYVLEKLRGHFPRFVYFKTGSGIKPDEFNIVERACSSLNFPVVLLKDVSIKSPLVCRGYIKIESAIDFKYIESLFKRLSKIIMGTSWLIWDENTMMQFRNGKKEF